MNSFDPSGVEITNSLFLSCEMNEELKTVLEEQGNVVAETLESLKEQYSHLSREMKKRWEFLLTKE